jgi:LPPG:FO 2-phospho-L-lactate transferase
MIVALCGGVGGAKLTFGLYRTLPPDTLCVVVNTADDLAFCGLHISPDLDTVTYTLAGVAGGEAGWGLEGDTHGALDMLGRYGVPVWFRVGDRDLATHLYRTDRLRRGDTLTAVTASLAAALGVRARILPMTDQRVATRLLVGDDWIDFQEYFVHRLHSVPVEAIRYDGIEDACPAPSVLPDIQRAEAVVIVNSNPLLSIMPILSVNGVRDALAATGAPRVAVSPMVASGAVSGPAGDLMRLVELPPTAMGVAALYAGLIDGMIIDARDEEQIPAIRGLGVEVLCTDALMRDERDRVRLATEVLRFAHSLR